MARRRHAHARTAPRIPFAVLGVTFPLASAFSMVGSHARLGGSRRMKSPPWLTLWTLFKRSQWLNQHLQGIVTHGRQVRARGPSRRQRLRPRGSGPGRRGAQEPLLIRATQSISLLTRAAGEPAALGLGPKAWTWFIARIVEKYIRRTNFSTLGRQQASNDAVAPSFCVIA